MDDFSVCLYCMDNKQHPQSHTVHKTYNDCSSTCVICGLFVSDWVLFCGLCLIFNSWSVITACGFLICLHHFSISFTTFQHANVHMTTLYTMPINLKWRIPCNSEQNKHFSILLTTYYQSLIRAYSEIVRLATPRWSTRLFYEQWAYLITVARCWRDVNPTYNSFCKRKQT